jgi:methionine-rich copper-binding protein CopC
MSTADETRPRMPRAFRLASLTAIAAMLAAVFVVSGAQSARGHDYLVSASPAADATVESPLTSVSLTLSEAPLEGLDTSSYITVVAADGRTASAEEVTVEGSTLSVPVTFGNPGIYTVTWQTVSSDGHPISGSYSFTWLSNGEGESGAPTATSSPIPSATETPSPPAAPAEAGDSASAVGVLFWAAALVLFLGLGATAYLVFRAQRRRAQDSERAP